MQWKLALGSYILLHGRGKYQNDKLMNRVKGCRSSNSAVAGASGLQYLVSNHEQVLADAVYRQFEIPLLEALDHYKLETADRLVMYEKALTEQSARIRKTESENLKNARRRKRGMSCLLVKRKKWRD